MSKKQIYRPDRDGPDRGVYMHNKALLRKTAQVCALCGLPLDRTLKYPDPMSISIDHIIPVTYGGRSTLDNLQATHLICNKQKGAKLFNPTRSESERKKDNNSSMNFKPKKDFSSIPQYLDWSSYKEE